MIPSFSGNTPQYILFISAFAIIICAAQRIENTNSKTRSNYESNEKSPLCPNEHSEYYKKVFDNKTGECAIVGSRGSCGELMGLQAERDDSEHGVCRCLITDCSMRPIAYWMPEDRCYFAFSQGPCAMGQWLVITNETPECQQNPCPPIESEQQNDYVESQTSSFYFTQNSLCYQTQTTGYCENGEKLYFLGRNGTTPAPGCYAEQPCKFYSGQGGAAGSTGNRPCPPGTYSVGSTCRKGATIS